MKPINKTAQKTFDKLIKLIPEGESHTKVDNSDGTFMAVSVEFLYESCLGPVYSLAHYYESYGDLVSDPEMTFFVGADGRAYPMAFEQGGRFRQESVRVGGGDVVGKRGVSVIPSWQKQQAAFAGQWLKNIKLQQGL